jgi:hypothetical protein
VDWIVDLAASLGLFIGMLPTWGDKWNRKWGAGPEIFTPASARGYGQFLGRRYAERPIIWILGGDRPVETEQHAAVIRAMAAGLKEGDGGRHLASFHPQGQQTSAQHFHVDAWLDFNMWQSGHNRNQPNYAFLSQDYARTPVKPCMDGEPLYEDHPSAFNLDNGYLDDYDVRKAAYWALCAGAHGHTYGCHPVWQMWQPGRAPVSMVRRPWQEALHLPGSGQMQHARALVESRPFFTRIPDQSLIVSDPGAGTHHVRAARSEDGSYAFIYVPSGKPVEVDLAKLSGGTLEAHWYDPRTGKALAIGQVPRAGRRPFAPPAGGPDWVLVLDDSERDFAAPGARPYVGG